MPDSWPFSGVLAPAVAAPSRTTEPGVREDRDTADDDLRTLVLHAKTGDSDAFGTLYDRYVDLVYRYIYFRVGSHPLAGDLTSATFLRARRRVTDFSWQGRDFGAWRVTIARNLVPDRLKASRSL